VAHCRLPIADCLLPIAYCCLLLVAYCLLPIAYCLLAIGYWLLAIGYWLLASAYHLPPSLPPCYPGGQYGNRSAFVSEVCGSVRGGARVRGEVRGGKSKLCKYCPSMRKSSTSHYAEYMGLESRIREIHRGGGGQA
jgi:hypothetical protein